MMSSAGGGRRWSRMRCKHALWWRRSSMGPAAPSSRASAVTSASSVSAATTRVARPSASASSASTSRPVSSRSLTRAVPDQIDQPRECWPSTDSCRACAPPGRRSARAACRAADRRRARSRSRRRPPGRRPRPSSAWRTRSSAIDHRIEAPLVCDTIVAGRESAELRDVGARGERAAGAAYDEDPQTSLSHRPARRPRRARRTCPTSARCAREDD